MTRIKMNREDIRDPFAVVPPGKYDVTCAVALKEQSKKGDDMIQLQLAITGGEPDDPDLDIAEHVGKKVRDYMVISGANAKYGLWRLLHYTTAAGLDIEDFELEELINVPFEVDIGVDPPDPDTGYGESNSVKRVYVEEDLS